jgi:DNA polymerase-3 subunit chi
MAEVLFYHLQRQPLEDVLPGLLERCLDRGWRAAVQTGSQERAEALDAHLWTYRDDAFLPHDLAGGDAAAEQPILLTSDSSNANGAEVRFLVDGAVPAAFDSYRRIAILFDGNDSAAVEAARNWWKQSREGGHSATYWQQNANGRWEEKG